MKLIGLMLVRNEDWILGASMRAALQWVDELVIMDHASHDGTFDIINQVMTESPWKVHYSHWRPTEEKELKSIHPGSRTILNATPAATWKAQVPTADEAHWDEMTVRHEMLLLGRRFGGTHFAMIDADEILTANLVDRARTDVMRLIPGQVLEYPMLAMRTLDEYQDDDTDWSKAFLSVAFADAPGLAWKPDVTGYHFHHRCPYGVQQPSVRPIASKFYGGVMHLQFADHRRLVAKHRYYKMLEVTRWPGRETVEAVDKKYSNAVQPPKKLTGMPPEWWRGIPKDAISLGEWPWHQGEADRLLAIHGIEKFKGLDLFGWPKGGLK